MDKIIKANESFKKEQANEIFIIETCICIYFLFLWSHRELCGMLLLWVSDKLHTLYYTSWGVSGLCCDIIQAPSWSSCES